MDRIENWPWSWQRNRNLGGVGYIWCDFQLNYIYIQRVWLVLLDLPVPNQITNHIQPNLRWTSTCHVCVCVYSAKRGRSAERRGAKVSVKTGLWVSISVRFTARDDKFDWVRLMNLGNEGELLVTVSEPARCWSERLKRRRPRNGR